tara:strand:+ start:2550 stop:2813 length:264 start_codon:yes stop_codon:yes gene_type:complete
MNFKRKYPEVYPQMLNIMFGNVPRPLTFRDAVFENPKLLLHNGEHCKLHFNIEELKSMICIAMIATELPRMKAHINCKISSNNVRHN